jgi:hypothetical protein
LITGDSAKQSTNLRAVNLPAVAVRPANRTARTPASSSAAANHPSARPWREKRGDEPEDLLKCHYYGANAGQAPAGSNIGALSFANAAFFLERLLRRIVLTLLLFVGRNNKRLRTTALDKVSSKQLVPSSPQERLK